MSDILTKGGGGGGGERTNLQEIPLTEGGVRGRLENALREQERDIEAEKCAREERHERFLKELDERASGGSERKLKTASLKRFLGLKPKKTSEPAMELAGQGGMVDIEKQNSANEDEDDGSEATASGGSELNKRFKMRLGGLHRNGKQIFR